MTARWTHTPDLFQGDIAVGPLYADRPPTRGLAGWTDWRLGEPVAHAMHSKRLKAALGEQILIAGRPPMGVGKIVLVGCSGPAADAAAAAELARLFADAIAGLPSKRMLIEVPARDVDQFVKNFAKFAGSNTPIELFAYVPEIPCRI